MTSVQQADAHEKLHVDVAIIGAGPAGLSAAIRLKQLAKQQNRDIRVAILEKGAEVGNHLLSGAVLEPRALHALLPDWQKLGAPLTTPVTKDRFYYFSRRRAWRLPTPPLMKNRGNYIISLAQFCRWLAEQAVSLGVDIYPGFAVNDFIVGEHNQVIGVVTGDMGRDKQGQPTEQYQPGIAIYCQQLLLAEGCRGALSEQIIQRYQLRKDKEPQTYALGVKELWRVPKAQHQPGLAVHSLGWPLDRQTFGGGFIYHWGEQFVALGLVVGLDYQNPYLDPFAELQRFKTHPKVATLLQGGERVSYGARSLNEGGWQSIPKLSFPGGLLLGDAAGFLNVGKLKGTHTAMTSGMLAAETLFSAIQVGAWPQRLTAYQAAIEKSWMSQELYRARNLRPGFHHGLWPGLAYAAIDQYLLRGKAPWTFHHPQDHRCLQAAKNFSPITYPKPDGKLTFDKLSSVYISNTFHRDNQPCHLRLKQPALAIAINYRIYASPETRYCPAQVYELVTTDKAQPSLVINAQNCIHCKACDIKDPKQNITWVPPEGGGGPNYGEM